MFVVNAQKTGVVGVFGFANRTCKNGKSSGKPFRPLLTAKRRSFG
jgi:hypothetical protein